ncbi:hypothetical protein PTKIN_Ptkin01aG0034500 [Pterospermum kingtungense]
MDLLKGDENVDELLLAQTHVWNHTYRFISSMSLKCAVELEIPDIIHNHGQPITTSDLALAIHIHPSKDNPLSTRPFLLAMLDPFLMKPYQYLSTWFQNDDPTLTVFALAHGSSMWEHAGHEPRLNQFFNEAMASDCLLAASVVLAKCKGVFEGLKSPVDVGGGTGTMTKVLAKAFPQMDCIVFDLPHVVDGLQGSENLKYVGGNMFEKVPPGEAIMLKWMLHAWSSENCTKILERCKEAIGSKEKGGKVIIIDTIIGNQEVDEVSVETKLFFDMEMMVCVEGQERNEQEWSKLFVAAGFTNYKIHHILGLRDGFTIGAMRHLPPQPVA